VGAESVKTNAEQMPRFAVQQKYQEEFLLRLTPNTEKQPK
jgi:hypothetical protein